MNGTTVIIYFYLKWYTIINNLYYSGKIINNISFNYIFNIPCYIKHSSNPKKHWKSRATIIWSHIYVLWYILINPLHYLEKRTHNVSYFICNISLQSNNHKDRRTSLYILIDWNKTKNASLKQGKGRQNCKTKHLNLRNSSLN